MLERAATLGAWRARRWPSAFVDFEEASGLAALACLELLKEGRKWATWPSFDRALNRRLNALWDQARRAGNKHLALDLSRLNPGPAYCKGKCGRAAVATGYCLVCYYRKRRLTARNILDWRCPKGHVKRMFGKSGNHTHCTTCPWVARNCAQCGKKEAPKKLLTKGLCGACERRYHRNGACPKCPIRLAFYIRNGKKVCEGCGYEEVR